MPFHITLLILLEEFLRKLFGSNCSEWPVSKIHCLLDPLVERMSAPIDQQLSGLVNSTVCLFHFSCWSVVEIEADADIHSREDQVAGILDRNEPHHCRC